MFQFLIFVVLFNNKYLFSIYLYQALPSVMKLMMKKINIISDHKHSPVYTFLQSMDTGMLTLKYHLQENLHFSSLKYENFKWKCYIGFCIFGLCLHYIQKDLLHFKACY